MEKITMEKMLEKVRQTQNLVICETCPDRDSCETGCYGHSHTSAALRAIFQVEEMLEKELESHSIQE